MGKIFLSITISLDGFSAGKDITQENPMGLNGQLLHQWLFVKKQKGDDETALETFKNTGNNQITEFTKMKVIETLAATHLFLKAAGK